MATRTYNGQQRDGLYGPAEFLPPESLMFYDDRPAHILLYVLSSHVSIDLAL